MINDSQLYFSNAQALTATADATNVIDASIARQLGDGRPLSVFIHVNVAADGTTTDETYAFSITTDDNASLSSDTTVVGPVSKTYTQLAINTLHEIPIPQNSVFEQYIGLVYTLGGTTPTVTVTSWLGISGQLPSVKTYPNGYNV